MRRKYGAVGLILALASLALTGCTGSNPLNTGNNGYQVVVTSSANPTQYSTMIFNLSGISATPTDPGAAAVLGTDSLDLISGGVEIDLNAAFEQPGASTLPVGTYAIQRVTINSMILRSVDLPANPTVCQDYIVGQLRTSGTFNLTLFSGDGTFTVAQDTPGQLSLDLDAVALRDAVFAGVNCGNCLPANCDTLVPFDPSCRCSQIGTNFQASPFRALSDTFLTVQ